LPGIAQKFKPMRVTHTRNALSPTHNLHEFRSSNDAADFLLYRASHTKEKSVSPMLAALTKSDDCPHFELQNKL
jgi:hypothetical protein